MQKSSLKTLKLHDRIEPLGRLIHHKVGRADYYDGYACETHRHVKGEWLFRRVLNGIAIQDLFICPSRETIRESPQPDGEYGAAIRVFNRTKKCYDMVYACEKYSKHLQFQKIDNKLVGTVMNHPTEKWVFSEITENTFHWQNITALEDGCWRINSDVFAHRKTNICGGSDKEFIN